MPISLILNGPPHSGKDTIAKMLEVHGFQVLEFKSVLFNIAMQVTGVSHADWFTRYNDRTLKEIPWERAGGLSQRQLLIKISEEWLKPFMGNGSIGKSMAQQVKTYMSQGISVVFSDGGFIEELIELTGEVGSDNVHLIRLVREGYDFEGDSRSYLYPCASDCFSADVLLKEGQPEDAVQEILGMLSWRP